MIKLDYEYKHHEGWLEFCERHFGCEVEWNTTNQDELLEEFGDVTKENFTEKMSEAWGKYCEAE